MILLKCWYSGYFSGPQYFETIGKEVNWWNPGEKTSTGKINRPIFFSLNGKAHAVSPSCQQELRRFPTLQAELATAAFEALERFREESKKSALRLVDMEASYLTVDFFRKLPQEMEKGGNPAAPTIDRYSEAHFRRIGSNVTSYIGMVSETLMNTIPKAAVHCQVREAKQSLLNHFYIQLGKKEVLTFIFSFTLFLSCLHELFHNFQFLKLCAGPSTGAPARRGSRVDGAQAAVCQEARFVQVSEGWDRLCFMDQMKLFLLYTWEFTSVSHRAEIDLALIHASQAFDSFSTGFSVQFFLQANLYCRLYNSLYSVLDRLHSYT